MKTLSRTAPAALLISLLLAGSGVAVASSGPSAGAPAPTNVYSGAIALSFNSPIRSSLSGALRLSVVDVGGGNATFTGTFTGVLALAWFRIPLSAPVHGTLNSGLNGGLDVSLDSGLNSGLDGGPDSGLNSPLDVSVEFTSGPTGLNSGLNSGLNGAVNVTVGLNDGLDVHSFTAPFVGSLKLRCTTCAPTGA